MRRIAIPLLACFLLAGAARAELVSQTITHMMAKHEFHSYVVYDDAIAGKRPGVLVVPEWWGLNDYAKMRADMLARAGYVAFVVDMYGMGKTTKDPAVAGAWAKEVYSTVAMEERSANALKLLAANERVNPDKLAAIGYCFGGTTVTRLAYYGAPLKGIVSFHGNLPPAGEGVGELVEARLLMCHGAADPFVSEETQTAFRAAAAREKLDWQLIYYADAKHAFTNPAADTDGLDGTNYVKAADSRSWAHMMLFFAEIFAD